MSTPITSSNPSTPARSTSIGSPSSPCQVFEVRDKEYNVTPTDNLAMPFTTIMAHFWTSRSEDELYQAVDVIDRHGNILSLTYEVQSKSPSVKAEAKEIKHFELNRKEQFAVKFVKYILGEKRAKKLEVCIQKRQLSKDVNSMIKRMGITLYKRNDGRLETNIEKLWDDDIKLAERCVSKIANLEDVKESTHHNIPLRDSDEIKCPICRHGLKKSNAIVMILENNNRMLVSREAISYIFLNKKVQFEEPNPNTGSTETITITREKVLNASFEPYTAESRDVKIYSFG